MCKEISANIEGIIQSLDVDDFMLAVYETVVNSFQAVEELGDKSTKDLGIRVIVQRDDDKTGCLFRPIKSITIIDNGVGFNSENFQSYTRAYSRKKAHKGGKGVGRFAALAVFQTLKIDSTFLENNVKARRSFTLSRKHEGIIEQHFEEVGESELIQTQVTLCELDTRFKEQSAKKQITDIARDILNHCLLYYLNESSPDVVLEEDNVECRLSSLYKDNNVKIGEYEQELKGEKFNVYSVKVKEQNLHKCYLCAHNRVVKTKRVTTLLPLFDLPIVRNGQSFYISLYVTSDYLDRIVNQSRTEFKFSAKTDDPELGGNLKDGCIQEDDVYEVVVNALNNMFSGELNMWRNVQRNKINEFLSRDDGVPFRNLNVNDDVLNKLRGNASDDDIREHLEKLRAERAVRYRRERDKLKERDYSDMAAYKSLMNEFLALWNQESSSHLAEYVTHRKVILQLMDDMLCWKENSNEYEKEQVLHNIIYTMGGTSETISYDKHNLWLLDDRLSYFRYIFSDRSIRTHEPLLGKSLSPKEPDICLYDVPYVYGDKDGENIIKSIVIFEFKRPGRSVSYADNSKQCEDQVEGVSRGCIQGEKGKKYRMAEKPMIYYYYVCDENAYVILKSALLRHSYWFSPYGSMISTCNNIHYEVITYAQVLANATRRNRIFFEKLGIS